MTGSRWRLVFTPQAAKDAKKLARSGLKPKAEALLEILRGNEVDYTRFFRRLAVATDPAPNAELASLFSGDEGAFAAWEAAWRTRLALEPSTADERAASIRWANPAFIPRNHRVEAVIEAAVRRGDFEPFETLLHVVTRPYEDRPEYAYLAEPPGPEQHEYKTFCGT